MSENDQEMVVHEPNEGIICVNLSSTFTEFDRMGSPIVVNRGNDYENSNKRQKMYSKDLSPVAILSRDEYKELLMKFSAMEHLLNKLQTNYADLATENNDLKIKTTHLQGVVNDLESRLGGNRECPCVGELSGIKDRLGVVEVAKSVCGMEVDEANGNAGGSWSDVVSRTKRLTEAKMINSVAVETASRNDRSKNIVISGLNFTNLTSDNTPTKIIDNFFREHSITEAYSIRRKIFHKNSSDIRMVVISVATVQCRDGIIRKFKTNMKNTTSTIYLNVDKTACELQLEYQLRLDLRDMIKNIAVEDKDKISFYIKDKSIFKVVQGVKGHTKVQSFN